MPKRDFDGDSVMATPKKPKPLPRVQKIKTKSSQIQTQQKIQRLQARLSKIEKTIPLKYYDADNTGDNVPVDADFVVSLVDPAQGDGVTERVGDVVCPIRIVGNLLWSNTFATDATATVRCTIIQVKDEFVPATNVASDANGLYSDTLYTAFCPFYWQNRIHYDVLFDKSMVLGPPASATKARLMPISVKVPRKIFFKPGLTTTESGKIYMCLTSNVAAASSEPVVYYSLRTYFKDG